MIFPAVFVILAIAVFGVAGPLIFIGPHVAGFAAQGLWIITWVCAYFWWIRPAARNRRRWLKIEKTDEPADDC